MVIKSLIILSIICNLVGLNGPAGKLDDAVVRDRQGAKKVALASDVDLKLPPILARPRTKSQIGPNVLAQNYILIDADSGTTILRSSPHQKVAIASTTKIMTAMIALENYKLNEVATISATAVNQVPSVAHLHTGEKITIENLLNCMLIPSGNDAAYATAEHMSEDTGGITKFVDKMNAKAKELGMTDTHYEDPAGLNPSGYSTAYDLFLITRYALKNPIFRQIVQEKSYVASNTDKTIYHSLVQSNRLITEDYPGAIGVKTGFTDEAGHCLVGAATRDGHTYIAIVLHTISTAPTASATEAKKLLDWGFENVYWE